MDGKVLGIERRRRWSRDEKARIVEETLIPGAVVSEVARRHGVAQSLLFTWRRLARTTEPARRDGSILLPVEIDAPLPPSEATKPSRPATSGRRMRSGVIEIELGSGSRVRVDNEVDADALRRVLGVLSER
ncbi:MAG TPA: transposase [Stellaceae bacterium]|jgi:transposase|nr:transposase [Stellaceae bacterium]